MNLSLYNVILLYSFGRFLYNRVIDMDFRSMLICHVVRIKKIRLKVVLKLLSNGYYLAQCFSTL